MPFATLPSSPGFQAPQAPDWGQFAMEAIRARERQPIPNTAAMVDQAVQQINGILQLQSPQAKMQRALQMQQLRVMSEVYRDYQANPNNYQMTAHGPVRIDPYARIERLARARQATAQADYLDKKTRGGGTPDFIKQAIAKMQTAINAEKQGVTIPGSKLPTTDPIPEANANPSSNDNEAESVATSVIPETPEPSGIAPNPFGDSNEP